LGDYYKFEPDNQKWEKITNPKKLIEILINGRKGVFEYTLLHYAAEYGRKEVAKALLEAGANIDSNDGIIGPPIFLAAKNDYSSFVDFLLTEGADVSIKNTFTGFTLLHIVGFMGHEDVVKVVLDHAKTKKGSPLQFFDFLNDRDKANDTALLLASYYGNEEVVKSLIQYSEDKLADSGDFFEEFLNAEGERKLTSLHLASANGYKTIVDVLLETKRIKLNVAQTNNMTPLHAASDNGHLCVVKALLKYAEDNLPNGEYRKFINAQGEKNKTALNFAAVNGHNEIALALVTAGADYTLFFFI